VKPFNVLCPFHREKTPSCRIWPNRGYHCHGCLVSGLIDEDEFLLQEFEKRRIIILEENGQLRFVYYNYHLI
jgi:DNA primase